MPFGAELTCVIWTISPLDCRNNGKHVEFYQVSLISWIPKLPLASNTFVMPAILGKEVLMCSV